jgi:hypothetical protein
VPEGFKIASAWVEVAPDDTGFREKLQAQLDAAVAGVDAKAKVGLDTDELDTKAAAAKAKISDLDGSVAKARADLNIDDLLARADEADAKLDELDGKKVSPKLGLDDDEFKEKLARDKAEADSAGGAGGGSIVGAITLGVSSLLPGIGGAAAGMGLLAGTGALALGGITKALSAHSRASQQTGTTSQQLASTAFSNSVAIQQAQQAVGQAYQQASQDAVTSAQQIQSSQASLAETVRNSASSQIQAVQAVAQSEEQLKDAQFSEQQAQENLTNARIQAKLTLQQLNDAQKDSVVAVSAAKLALEQAQQQQQVTDQNAMSTSLDRQQAALAVTQAQRQLIEAQQNQTSSADAAQRADKQGVNGSQQVVLAKHAVRDAINAVRDAEQQAGNAQRNLTDTELNNAQAIKQAQLSVTQAEQQAARSQERDAEAIAAAQRNLSDTYQEQKLAAAATASTSNKANNQFLRDMGLLTPAARNFVHELLGMRSGWHELQDTAQNAVLPGLTVFLRGVKSDLPEVNRGVREMGDLISTGFADMGKDMQTKGAKDVLSGLISNGIEFAKVVLPAVGQFIGELGEIGSKKGAVDGLSGLIAGVARGLTGLARGVGPYTTQINAFLIAAGHILAAIGPPLGRMVGLIATTLGPLTRYLDAHPNGTVVKIIGDLVAGLLTLKGMQKILPDVLTKPLSSVGNKITAPLKAQLEKIPGLLASPFKSAAGKIPDLLAPVWESITTRAAGMWASVEAGAGTAAGTVARWGEQFAGTVASAAGSMARFASGMVTRLAEAGGATAGWIVEQSAAAAAFIAENVAMALSATAAFIAENAATLGLVAGIVALVAAIVFLATHWQQVWGDIKTWAEDAWHFIYDGFGKYLLPLLGPVGLIALGVIELSKHWSQIWGDIKGAYEDVTSRISSGARTFVSDLGVVWSKLESIFKSPVNFLIGTVYDKGIARLWNDVVEHIGLGSIKLPVIAKLTGGGKIPGYGGGDTQPALLEMGETVIDKDRSKVLAPVFAAAGVPGYSGGGLVGDIGGFFRSVGSGIVDSAKFAASLAANPGKAVTDLLTKVVGTQASGDLGKVMTGIPKALISDLAKAITSSTTVSGGRGPLPGGGSSAVGALPANWKTIAGFLATHGFSKIAAAGVAGNIDAESGGNPEILEIGGGGGGGLIQWTPYPASYITGDVARDLTTQLNAVLEWGGGPGLVNRAKSPSNAAEIYQDYYERPANLTASLPQRMASANAVYKAMGWGTFDNGGWLMPASAAAPNTIPVNQTGQPEAVLDPDESAAFVALVRHLLSGSSGGTAGGAAPVANFNYFGTQYPTAEQRAMQQRDLALLLGGN